MRRYSSTGWRWRLRLVRRRGVEIPEPQFAITRAVTIAAPPEAVWPWIVQIGYHRAGWYAHDLFDNDDIPSAETILPEFQHLEIGQVIGEEGLAVRKLEPGRHLVLAFHYPKTEWVIKHRPSGTRMRAPRLAGPGPRPRGQGPCRSQPGAGSSGPPAWVRARSR